MIIGSVGLVILAISLGRYSAARLNWYNMEIAAQGPSRLVACHAGTPLFANSGIGIRPEVLPSVRTARFDAWVACKSIDAHRELLVSGENLDGSNALSALVTMRSGCTDNRFDKSQIAICESAIYASIDWLLENGVQPNSAESCVYLRETYSTVLDEEMFAFLLSRGASVDADCPSYLFEREYSDEHPRPVNWTLVDDLNLHRTMFDTDAYPELEERFVKMIKLAREFVDET